MSLAPPDADARREVAPVICYPVETLPLPDMALYDAARASLAKTAEVIVPPREAGIFTVPAAISFGSPVSRGRRWAI